MQTTTALRKIAGLTKRIKGIQGGQGAGKTYAILILLINHASGNSNKEIFIASEELSKMRITVIKDFLNIIKEFGIYRKENFVDGTLYRFPNGSFIKFIGLDKEDIGKGLRCDVMFVNEANKTKFDTYRELTSRAKQIFIDFNPNSKFWFHTEVIIRNDCQFLKLTYLDNEYLGKEERSEILRYRERGYKSNGAGGWALDDKGNMIVINQYWANMWRVYGLGEVGQVEGRIYNWMPIAYDEYLKIEKQVYYGNDWGKVDPWAVVEVKYHDGCLYVHEKNYASENEIERNMSPSQLFQIRSGEYEMANGQQYDGLMAYMFNKMSIEQDKHIVCDSNRPNKILSLRNSGWEYAVGVGQKSRVIERVGLLAGLNIYYTDCSKNIEAEQENYCYAKDKFGVIQEEPVDQDNHTIDAIVYCVQMLFNEGIIKHI
jgi:phage terminase large subunit